MQVDLLKHARDCEKIGKDLRVAMTHLDVEEQGAIHTIRYCGAMLSLVASTLANLHEKLHPVFDMKTVNGILREWGEKELTDD